jgi:C-terminal processing protease CtpA/Prc
LLRLNGAIAVRNVEPNTPAQRAGFQVHDELVSFNNKDVEEKPIAEINWLMRRSVNRGEAATATVRRSGELQKLVFNAD